MYAVIFSAEIRKLDQEYSDTAAALRQRAIDEFGCLSFTAVTEGNREIAISHWNSLEAIRAWKADPAHQAAQKLGRERWYSDYRVEVVEVVRAYGGGQ